MFLLNGDFERAFASEGVQFDKQKGAFHIHATLRPEVYLTGPPDLVSWTQRSMERIGLTLCVTAEDALIRIDASAAGWQVEYGNAITHHRTVYDLVTHISTRMNSSNISADKLTDI
jgi:hypothetical protein